MSMGEDNRIRDPGPWLNEDLTQDEVKDIIKLSETAANFPADMEWEDKVNAMVPYLNSYMHLLYRLSRGKLGLSTTATGVIDKDGNPYDMVGAIVDLSISTADLLPRTTALSLEKLLFPIDKVNRHVWNLLEETTGKQIAIGVERRGDPKEINLLYSIDFDDLPQGLTITKKLEPYDKRVYITIAALFNAGKRIVTYTEIYKNMGYTGRPGQNDLDKIDKAVSKMSAAHIYLSNDAEIKAAYKRNRYVYDGALLPIERVRAIVNGQLAESAVKLFREPPLVSFARDRKQITTITRKMLESPLSKTDENIRIEDYLIEEIASVKRGQRRNKFLYETVFEKTGLSGKSKQKQRQRAPEKIRKLLAHYVSCGTISRYELSQDGFTIYYNASGQNSDA